MTGTRCLLIECCPYHWEVIPGWVDLLQELGVRVDLATDETPGHRETFENIADRGVDWLAVRDLLSTSLEMYDFVLLGTLIHEGYGLDLGPVPQPCLRFLEDDLGLPSLSVVHEPLLWTHKAPKISFDVSFPGGSTALMLYENGSFYVLGDPWIDTPWRCDGETLSIPMADRPRTFVSQDDGANYASQEDNVRLHRRPAPDLDLKRLTTSGRHRVLALTQAGHGMLTSACPSADWLTPLSPKQDQGQPVSPYPVVFAGQLDYDRKAIPSLIDLAPLGGGERIQILGGSRDDDFEANPHIQRFRREIAERGLEDAFELTGYLPYGEFLNHIAKSRFIMPLIDPWVDGGAYLYKLPALISLALEYGVPMILEETMAAHFGLDFMITYPGQDLTVGVEAARQLDPAGAAALRRRTREAARAIHKRSLSVLRRNIESILDA